MEGKLKTQFEPSDRLRNDIFKRLKIDIQLKRIENLYSILKENLEDKKKSAYQKQVSVSFLTEEIKKEEAELFQLLQGDA